MTDNQPADLAKLEKVPDYRFARLVKGDKYAYARGLTINPTHLPLALDAMLLDGWRVISVFGQTDSENVGFLFENVSVGDQQTTQHALDNFMSALGQSQVELWKSDQRIINLLTSNNELVETVREQRERLRRFELLYGVLGE